MSDKEKGLPLLRKTPVDFLSREEARQALNRDTALDASEAARALRTEPNNKNIILARQPREPRQPRIAREPRVTRQPRESRQPWVARQSWIARQPRIARIVVR